MKIRWIEEKDFIEVEKLASKNGILLPNTGSMMVAEREDGTLVGLINIRQICMIEPLISESPVTTNKLFENAVGAVKAVSGNIIRGIVKKNSKVFKLANRVGFYEVFEDHCIIELDITNMLKKENKLQIN